MKVITSRPSKYVITFFFYVLFENLTNFSFKLTINNTILTIKHESVNNTIFNICFFHATLIAFYVSFMRHLIFFISLKSPKIRHFCRFLNIFNFIKIYFIFFTFFSAFSAIISKNDL